MKLFRLLRADEIECRVSRCTEKGAALLLYKTARTDADLLDETFGPHAWENDFKLVDGVLYGGIGIAQDGVTRWKWDAGVESNTEAEKGRASDAFKRAGFKWGIGRELYSAPYIWVPAGKCNLKSAERGGKIVWACNDRFDLAEIGYDAAERVAHVRVTLNGQTVFEWRATNDHGKRSNPPETGPTSAPPMSTGEFIPTCAACWKQITEAEHDYSCKRYGRPLCRACQKNAGQDR